MRGMPGRREALEPDDRARRRRGRSPSGTGASSPQRSSNAAVQPARARLESRRVDHVRCADLRDVHLEPRVLPDEGAGCSRVVEVDVREQQVPNVHEIEPALGEPGLQVRDRTSSGRSRRAPGRPRSRGDSSRRFPAPDGGGRSARRASVDPRCRRRTARGLALLHDLLEPRQHLLPVRLRVLRCFRGRVVVLAQRDSRLRRHCPRART